MNYSRYWASPFMEAPMLPTIYRLVVTSSSTGVNSSIMPPVLSRCGGQPDPGGATKHDESKFLRERYLDVLPAQLCVCVSRNVYTCTPYMHACEVFNECLLTRQPASTTKDWLFKTKDSFVPLPICCLPDVVIIPKFLQYSPSSHTLGFKSTLFFRIVMLKNHHYSDKFSG